MRPIRLTTVAGQNSGVIPLNYMGNPFSVSIAALWAAGAVATGKIQFTFDDVNAAGYDPNAATSHWFDHPNMTGISADTAGSLISPVTGIRWVQTAGVDAVSLVVIQSGGVGGS